MNPNKKKPEVEKLNPFKEAAKESLNVVSLAGCAAVSMATLNPLPLLVGAIAEAAYLLSVPDTGWYQGLLARRQKVLQGLAAIEYRESLKKDILPTLPPALAERYRRLDNTRQALQADLPGGDVFYVDIMAKLDHLLESFLYFAQKDVQFRSYLLKLGGDVRAVKNPPTNQSGKNKSKEPKEPRPEEHAWVKQLVEDIDASYQDDIEEMQKQVASQSEPSAIVQKRLEVVKKRSQQLHKIGDTVINLQHQMSLLEDTFGLISDEIRARSPKDVLTDVEDVVTQTNLMNDVLDQFGNYEGMMA